MKAKAFTDLTDLPEDDRIAIIARTAADPHAGIIGFVVDDDEKADRYITTLMAASSQVRIIDRGPGPHGTVPDSHSGRKDTEMHEHENDEQGRQICTTSGEEPSKVRAEQTEDTGQHKSYIVLCEDERKKGFVRPYRDSYRHTACGTVTTMDRALSETYARDPSFYGATFCVNCNRHLPVSEFVWTADGATVGS